MHAPAVEPMRALGPGPRVHHLDLLRFLAAIAVVMYHHVFEEPQGAMRLAWPMLRAAAKYGYVGVPVFFVISGYVILMSARGKDWRQFVAARIARLYPAFWFCCTLTYVATVWWGGERLRFFPSEYVKNMTMLADRLHSRNIDGVYWTLYIELRFYALTLLLIAFRRAERCEPWLWAWLIIAGLSRVWRVAIIADLLITDSAPLFIAGCCLYLIRVEGWSPMRIVMLASCYLGSMDVTAQFTRARAVAAGEPISADVACVIVTASFAWFLVLGDRRVRMPPRLAVAMGALGALTYPLYLGHENLGSIAYGRWLVGWPIGLAFTIVTAGALLLAAVVHVAIERPGGRMLRRVADRWLQDRNLKDLKSEHRKPVVDRQG